MTIRTPLFCILLALALGVCASQGRAQTSDAQDSREGRELRAKVEEIDRVAETEFDRGRESAERRVARARFEKEKGIRFSPLSFEDKTVLAPPQEDAARHAALLAQPDTGLVRLLPQEKFKNKLAVRGGGAFYSFAHLVHEYNYGSDIGLVEQDLFSVGFAGAGFGLLFDLGDIALEEVTNETEPVRFLASFIPPAAEPEARKIQRQLHYGFQHGWFVYRNRIPIVEGRSYAVRSVDYEMSDVLVAFRVLSKNSDGSVVLLWKLLKRFPNPRLERNLVPPRP